MQCVSLIPAFLLPAPLSAAHTDTTAAIIVDAVSIHIDEMITATLARFLLIAGALFGIALLPVVVDPVSIFVDEAGAGFRLACFLLLLLHSFIVLLRFLLGMKRCSAEKQDRDDIYEMFHEELLGGLRGS
jgi:hypothetical protein